MKRHSDYYQNNKVKWVQYTLKNPLLPEQKLLTSAKHRAKKRGIAFNLSLDDVIIPDFCPISGIPLFRGNGRPCENSPNLDRIDNSKGYIKGNVAVISSRINRRKSDLSVVEITKLYQYVTQGMTNG